MTKSIDDESPEAWSRINKWHRNGPDQHPLFPTKDENMPEAKMAKSYTRQGYKFKTAWGDDDVNNPTHYADQGAVECIDAMESMLSREEFIGFLRGNSFKYRWRCRSKDNAVKDLRKAQWYENKLLSIMEEEEGANNDK
tara:strand:- start:56 stop:472 length:417 start_codon:yes stop_codon:yes gene_type:complete